MTDLGCTTSSTFELPKSLTGVNGLDEITNGGLPKGRTTLLCGSTGCGKTLLATEFLVNGINIYNEPGVFMAFEETAEDLTQNVASLGFDLHKLQEEKKLKIDYVRVNKEEIAESGDYDLEGLFIRLDHAIKTVGAKRVVLDTIESLFSGLGNVVLLRSELKRLFNWLKERGVTSIITAETSGSSLSRFGIEEFVSDCVILLDNRVANMITTRRMRIVKYRGSTHGTNEYPYLIDQDGISVLPITSLKLDHDASNEREPTGIARLDDMLEGKGVYKGSTTLILGSPGTGKSSISATFASERCRQGQKCLYFAFEESEKQILRNMSSIGLHLGEYVQSGLLQFRASRPSIYGLEMHLVMMYKCIEELKPDAVVVDPMTNMVAVGDITDVKSMLTRLIDYLKTNMITSVFTALVHAGADTNTVEGISSLIDTLIYLRNIEENRCMIRGLQIVKSRGMDHSNQVREFKITSNGLDLLELK